ncbi:ESPR domain-containing protein, partial [Chromobacterium piscinae]
MNKIFKIKWSAVLAAWVVVSEIASHVGRKAKRSSRRIGRTVLNTTLMLSIVAAPGPVASAVPASATMKNVAVTPVSTSITGLAIQAPNGWALGAQVTGSYQSFAVNHPVDSTRRTDNSLYLWHHTNQYDTNGLRAALLASGQRVPIQTHTITNNDVAQGLVLSVLPQDNKGVMGAVVSTNAQVMSAMDAPTITGMAQVGANGGRISYTAPAGHTGAVTYSSSNEAVATVDPSGNINWLTAGSVYFTVELAATMTHQAVSNRTAEMTVAHATVTPTLATISGATVGGTS